MMVTIGSSAAGNTYTTATTTTSDTPLVMRMQFYATTS
jgi:hypothetical protein